MRKLIYSVAISLVCGLTAGAAVPTMSVQKSSAGKQKIENLEQLNASKLITLPSAAYSKNPKARQLGRQLTAQDFVGEYYWMAGNPIGEDQQLPLNGSMSITLDYENPGSVIVTGLDYFYPLSGYVEDGKLVIPNQFLYVNSYYNIDVYFWNISLSNNDPQTGVADGAYYFNPFPQTDFYFEMTENGHLVAGAADLDDVKFDNHEYTNEELAQKVCLASEFAPTDEGLFWIAIWLEADQIVEWAYEEGWWKPVGDATFKDAWLPIFWKDNETPEYTVPLYRNYGNDNLFMLYNPYGPETPYGENNLTPADEMGYLVFDISDPDCVFFKPLVYSCSINGATPDDEPIWFPMYFANEEGYLHDIQNATSEDILINFINAGYKVSNFSATSEYGPMVEIYNGCFGGYTGSMVADNVWSYENDFGEVIDVPMTGWVILPDEYDSVKDVISAASNDPVVYYNMQGVQVLNPAKGQLVIKKQGNKTVKTVVR